MIVLPYLDFSGRAEEAAEFYQKAVGAKVNVKMRVSDSPDPMPPGMMPPGSEQKILHMELQIGASKVMATDGMCTGKTNFAGVSLTAIVDSPEEAGKVFASLTDGGNVQMPLGPTFFAHSFGTLSDKFGVTWMVIAPLPMPN